MADYIKNNFQNTKVNLDKDNKTLLSNHNVTETSLEQLLHTGAHNYTASASFE